MLSCEDSLGPRPELHPMQIPTFLREQVLPPHTFIGPARHTRPYAREYPLNKTNTLPVLSLAEAERLLKMMNSRIN